MSNRYPISTLSDYEVMIQAPLSSFEQKLIKKLYMPIVGDKVISLYETLYTFINEGSFESNIDKHETIIKQMHLRSINRFIEIRNQLEAIGLLKVYYKDSLYIYYLKRPLIVEEFFNDIELSTLLEYQIGHEGYEKLYKELMMRKLDINKFEDITHNFDEIYDIEPSDNILISQESFNNINNGIVVTNKDFDYNQFCIFVSAHDILKKEYYASNEFINNVKRYSFLYKLNEEDMKNAVIMACDMNKDIDYSVLAKASKKIYEDKNKKLGVVPKNTVKATASTNDKLIKFLESTSPTDFVKHKSGTALTSTEIEMFDALLRDTNIGIGILNVLIGHVLENLNGEIPSYNYFLKVINTWKRAQIKSTKDAIDYISGKQKTKTTRVYNKNQKEVPTWYNEYVEELEDQKKTKDNNQLSDLEELKEFFKPIKKE